MRGRITDDAVNRADGLAAVRSKRRSADFELIQLFEHHHGNKDFVFFEIKQCVRVVNQYVRVQRVNLDLTHSTFLSQSMAWYEFAMRTASAWPTPLWSTIF